MIRIYSTTFFFLLFSLKVLAQSGGLGAYLVNPEKQGDRLFENYAFVGALEAYQKACEKGAENDQLRLKIAESYRMLNNPAETEKWYSKVEAKEFAFKPEHLWYYAEALSSTGRYQEAQKWYGLYQQNKEADTRALKKMEGIGMLPHLKTKNAEVVTFQLAPFNSGEADFSPAYYSDGILFISGRSETKKNLFQWDKSAYLDIYFCGGKGTLTPRKLEGTINSAYHEGPLVFYQDDTKLIFTRNNLSKKIGKGSDGVTRLKLYYSEKTEGDSWSEAVPLPFNSDEYSTGHPAISSDGKILYFASDRPGGYGGSDLYKVVFKDGSWQNPENMGDEINTEGNEFFPFLHQDQQLYFASNGHGGLGGLDIFGIDLSSGRKADVVNVGAPLNSSLDDFGLILNESGTEGYFSSNRPGGIGNDDVYRFTAARSLLRGYSVSGKILATLNEKPLQGVDLQLLDAEGNVLKATQTGADGSYSFEVDADKTYELKAEKREFMPLTKRFLTTKSEGPEWVYNLSLPEKTNYALYALIQDDKTKEVIRGVQVRLIDNMSGEVVLEKQTGPAGDFTYYLKDKQPKDRISFQIKLSKEGYLSKTVTYNAALNEPGQIKLHELMKFNLDKIDLGIDLGKLAGVQPIYFDLGKSTLRKEAAAELDKIVAVMKENISLSIELGSHTDSRGSSASNLQLSEKRAKASADYIISKGIDGARVVAKGYGESEIMNHCQEGVSCSEADHQQNRRTEFMVTKF